MATAEQLAAMKKVKDTIAAGQGASLNARTQTPNPTTLANPNFVNGTGTADGSGFNSRATAVKTPTATPKATPTVQPSQPAQNTQPAQPAQPELTAAQLDEQDRLAAEGMVEAGMKKKNELASRYGLPSGPDTIQGVVDEFKNKQVQQKTAMQKQIETQNLLDQAESERFNEQAQGAKGATSATYAQGREGATSGSAGKLSQEFTAEMDKRINENKIRLKAAQDQRDNLMLQLEEAQKQGADTLIEGIQKQLGYAQQQIQETRTNYLNSLTQANEQARLAEQSTRQNVETFTGLVQKGTTMTPEGISAMAGTLGVPFDVAFDYYKGAEAIRANNKLDLEEKKIKLGDLKFNFDEKISGIRGEQAQAVSDFTKLAKSGDYTPDQLAQFATAMKIPNEMNPIYQNELKMNAAKLGFEQAQAKIEQYKADHLGEMPPEGTLEYLQYRKAEIELNIAEAENSDLTGVIPDSKIKEIFSIPGKSRVTPGLGEGKKQCAEAYNDLTTGPKAGTTWASKMATVSKRDNPQVGNGLALPIPPGTKIGHYETVISVNEFAGTFKTVSYNRDGKGGQTIQYYSVSQLQAKHGDNFGFSNSKLKPQYAEKLNSAVDTIGSKGGKYNEFKAKAISEGMPKDEAEKWAKEQTEKALEASPEGKTVPEKFSWASTIIDNTFGAAEGGKAAARKNQALATAIENGDGKTAKNIVYNAVLQNVTAGERTAFEDALTVNDAYAKTQSALAEFKQAGLDTGLAGNTMNEIYKNLTIKRPAEAVKLKTRLEQSFNAYRKAITGAGASEGELKMLAESVPTYAKNLDDIQVMLDIQKQDAKDMLDRKVNQYSSGAFDSYDDMNSRLNSLSGHAEDVKKQSAISGFFQTLIGDHAESTGKYVIPESLPAYEF